MTDKLEALEKALGRKRQQSVVEVAESLEQNGWKYLPELRDELNAKAEEVTQKMAAGIAEYYKDYPGGVAPLSCVTGGECHCND